jgi:regulatory protein
MSDDAIEARKKAMDLLARREYGRAELERKLIAAGFDADVAADALQRLAEEGLQSDRRFVESFVQSRINQGKGPLRIHADLGQRGIASGLVDEVLEEAGEDWYALARDARLKKFGRSQPAGFRDKARQMRFLQYRGFEPDQIQAAVAPFDD